jgi:uncharacterized protein
MGSLPSELELFPLRSVLFPDGLLRLRVFEARYLDLVSRCLRESRPFGVVALRHGTEVRQAGAGADQVELMPVGTLAQHLVVDSAEAGILQLQCCGGPRFTLLQPHQLADGLWTCKAEWLAPDEAATPEPSHVGSVKGLANAMATLKAQGTEPFLAPHRFGEAGWVANRWCEILPIPLAAKQKLMELPDPGVRLQLVDAFLRSKGVVKDG